MDQAINPKFTPPARRKFSTDELFAELRKGNKAALSEAITWIESNDPEKSGQGKELLKRCYPFSGNSKRIGVTGMPGAGKSTFIESIGNSIVAKNKKLAVLAIDPSSSINKGSILGDKTRMQDLSVHPNVFIRPTASANELGGVARNTFEAIILCEAAGYEYVLVETVGVGQSETEVKQLTDLFILLLIAGAGDELQGIKRGIMEMADFIVINKADGENKENAQKASKEIENALNIITGSSPHERPGVYLHSFLEKKLVEKIFISINQYFDNIELNNKINEIRAQQQFYFFNKLLKNRILNHIISSYNLNKLIKEKENQINNFKKSAFEAVDEVISVISSK